MTALDLESVFLSLSPSGRAVELPGKTFFERLGQSPADMAYLVSVGPQTANWGHWEMHPNGDEVLVLLEGRLDVIFDRDGFEERLPFVAGQTLIVPQGVWHRAEVKAPGRMLGLTYGEDTQHRPL